MKAVCQVIGFVLTSAIILTGCSKTGTVEQAAPEEESAPEETQTIPPGQLGSKAASLESLTLVKGGPANIEAGKVYVIEFWATWCGPCMTSIPHLTEIQKEYEDRGVTVIGISNETVAVVKPFVEKTGEKMDYVVAVDPERRVSDGYMEAFGRGGIPSAFIVDGSGNVVWVGHPMDGMDESLEQILAGTYDMAERVRMVAEKKKRKEQAELAYKKRYAELEAKVEQLSKEIEKKPEDIELLLKRAQVYLGDSFTTELSYNPMHLNLSLRDYQRVLELDPEGTHDAAEHAAFFEAWQDRSDQRIEKLDAFAKQYPDSVRIPFAMYSLYYDANEKGDTAAALKYLTIVAHAKLGGRFGEFLDEKKVALEAAARTD